MDWNREGFGFDAATTSKAVRMNHHRRGLSIAEVIIVVVIGLIGLAMLFPFLGQAREAARQSTCKNNLKQIYLALDNYREHFDGYPPGCVGNPDLSPEQRWSWKIGIKPFLEQGPVLPINYMSDSSVAENVLAEYDVPTKDGEGSTASLSPRWPGCPNGQDDKNSLDYTLGTYYGMAGLGKDAATLPQKHPRAGMWGYDRLTVLGKEYKGREYTIFVIESSANRLGWYRGGTGSVRAYLPNGSSPIGDKGQFGGYHEGMAHTLFLDGRVKPLSENIDSGVFKPLTTIAQETGNE
jgi:type II secretory pathway pseudopilin PulG